MLGLRVNGRPYRHELSACRWLCSIAACSLSREIVHASSHDCLAQGCPLLRCCIQPGTVCLQAKLPFRREIRMRKYELPARE